MHCCPQPKHAWKSRVQNDEWDRYWIVWSSQRDAGHARRCCTWRHNWEVRDQQKESEATKVRAFTDLLWPCSAVKVERHVLMLSTSVHISEGTSNGLIRWKYAICQRICVQVLHRSHSSTMRKYWELILFNQFCIAACRPGPAKFRMVSQTVGKWPARGGDDDEDDFLWHPVHDWYTCSLCGPS